MTRPKIAALITDLDNTVYDWLTAFVPAFYAMVQVAAPLIAVSEEQLLDDLQIVHRKHGDTEHPMALLETRAVRERLSLPDDQIAQILEPALSSYGQVWNANLRLYAGSATRWNASPNFMCPSSHIPMHE